MRNRKSENGGGAAGAMMLLGAVLAAHGAFAAAVADGARAVNCPEGPITNVVRAAAVPATDRGFTVAFRFKASPYVKRPGPWEGLVFANGNGWDTGFRATVTPDTGSSPGGFRMSLRVVKPERGGVGVPVKQRLVAGRWYHIAFVLGGGELKSFLNGTPTAKSKFEGAFRRAHGGFSVGPAGYGVGYYPFEAADFKVWERALSEDEVLALVMGGDTSAKSVKRYLEGLDEAAFAEVRLLAWNTAKKLADAGERTDAAALYALLAARAPAYPSADGGNEAAARFAKARGGRRQLYVGQALRFAQGNYLLARLRERAITLRIESSEPCGAR